MRRTLLASLGLLVVAPLLAAPPDWAAHYRERVALFAQQNAALPAGKTHVVLVGDSLTEGWGAGEPNGRIAKYLGPIAGKVLNRGIASDGIGVNVRGVKRRLDESVFDTRPERIVLLIGVNDVGRDGSGVAGCVRTYREVVRQLRSRLPEVPLHLVTTPPARGGYAALNPHIRSLNEQIETIARDEGAGLIDLYAAMVDANQALVERFSADGLHWTNAGYEQVGKTYLAAIQAPGGGLNGALDRSR